VKPVWPEVRAFVDHLDQLEHLEQWDRLDLRVCPVSWVNPVHQVPPVLLDHQEILLSCP